MNNGDKLYYIKLITCDGKKNTMLYYKKCTCDINNYRDLIKLISLSIDSILVTRLSKAKYSIIFAYLSSDLCTSELTVHIKSKYLAKMLTDCDGTYRYLAVNLSSIKELLNIIYPELINNEYLNKEDN